MGLLQRLQTRCSSPSPRICLPSVPESASQIESARTTQTLISASEMARHPSPSPSDKAERSEDGKSARKSERSPESGSKTRESSGSKFGRRRDRSRSESPEGREDDEERRSRKGDKLRGKSRSRSRSRRSRSESNSGSEYSSTEGSSESYSESDSEEERRRRRRRRRERRRREEEEEERRRRRRKREKERKRRKTEKEEDDDVDGDRKKIKRKDKEKKKKKDEERAARGKTGAVTNSWGKYGIIRETDMWNKRPEFTAWLAEVKQVNLEGLANWEEKQMFKEFMEDHNTATFPSKKYYNLDAFHGRQMEKELKKGLKKVVAKERTVFNDEEQRRQEMLLAREKQKEEEVEALKRSMQDGMAQDMKDQARLREEMAYQYKLGNFEAAAAIQRRLDPNIAM